MTSRRVRTLGYLLLGAGAAAGAAVLILRAQVARHRRNLFSPNRVRRLAALEHLAGEPASVRTVTLLRDFRRWEPHHLLQTRAKSILARMENDLLEGEAGLSDEEGAAAAAPAGG